MVGEVDNFAHCRPILRFSQAGCCGNVLWIREELAGDKIHSLTNIL